MQSKAEQEILLQKHRRAMELRAEFIKQSQNPFRHGSGAGGTLFDAGVARFQALKVNQYEHFKPTFKSFKVGIMGIIFPIAIYAWILKRDRDQREQKFRTGQVAYKDRLFKFI